MKNLFLIIIVLFAIFLGGCSTTLLLRDSPPDLVMTSIRPDNKNVMNYNYSSTINGDYKYDNFVFPINEAMQENIQSYISTKFLNSSNSGADSAYVIKIKLESFDVKYTNQNGLLTGLANGLAGMNLKYQGTATVRLSLNVQLHHSGKEIGHKDFFVEGKSAARTTSGGSDQDALTKAANDAISRVFIMIDKYLTGYGL